MAGIYIHIPFCKQKCSYCNFHFSTRLQGKGDIQNALLRELEIRQEEIKAQRIETIYLGGGTPSLWTVKELEQLFLKIESFHGLHGIEEITIECNPDDMTQDFLRDMKKYTPVNRISIGIQSFDDQDLKRMNRSHRSHEARKALEAIFRSGYEEVSADLIFGLPDSNINKWLDNLSLMTDYPIHHISCYNLTIEDKTSLKYQLEQGRLTLPDDKNTIGQFYKAKEYLTGKGYLHYEISNYGRPGHLALHNTNYWKSVPYIGIGPSAHSYDGFRRRWNVSDNQKYARKISSGDVYWDTETLDDKDQYNEYIMTGLRTMWGINEAKIKEFKEAIRQEFYKNLEREIRKENIQFKNSSYILTPRGQAVADQIITGFFWCEP